MTPLGNAILDLFQFFFLKVEMMAVSYAIFIPVIFHKLIVDLWGSFKTFIGDCIEIQDTVFQAFTEEFSRHLPTLYAPLSDICNQLLVRTRNNAIALERKRELSFTALSRFFNLWKRRMTAAGYAVEEHIIHPSVSLATQMSVPIVKRALEISEPTITMTQPVWEPIRDVVVEVNGTVVAMPVFGPMVGKMECKVSDAIDSISQYCNAPVPGFETLLQDRID